MGLDSNNAILNMMYRGTTTIANFNWDAMTTVPILYLMTPDDIDYIKNLILSPRYSGNNKYKMEKIDEIMHYRGFSDLLEELIVLYTLILWLPMQCLK